MGPAMEQLALHSAQIVPPLLLQMDQRPLPPTEGEMLQTGELEELLLPKGHPMRVQVMPAGRADSSTVTT